MIKFIGATSSVTRNGRPQLMRIDGTNLLVDKHGRDELEKLYEQWIGKRETDELGAFQREIQDLMRRLVADRHMFRRDQV